MPFITVSSLPRVFSEGSLSGIFDLCQECANDLGGNAEASEHTEVVEHTEAAEDADADKTAKHTCFPEVLCC